MRLPTYRFSVMLFCALGLGAVRAEASPVTVTYVVSQIQLCYFNDGSVFPTCSAAPDMTLTLSYDDGVSSTLTSGMPGSQIVEFRFIEAVPTLTLSGLVPLANPFGAPETMDTVLFGATEEVPSARTELARALTSVSHADTSTSGTTRTDRNWGVSSQLSVVKTASGPQDLVLDPPTTADVEARFRGSLSAPLRFEYFSYAFTDSCDLADCTRDWLPGSLQLTGIATPVAAAVPEPASVVLLGSGLAGVMYRRRRRSRQ